MPLFGEIWCESASSASWQIEVVSSGEVFQNTPAKFSVTENSLESIEITLSSVGLAAAEHEIDIKYWGQTANSLRVDGDEQQTFTVTAFATANNSRAEVVGDPPVMGEDVRAPLCSSAPLSSQID